MIRFLMLAALLVGVAGCANDAQLIQALSQDKNSVCLQATYVYGSVTISRNGGCSQMCPVNMGTKGTTP